MKGYERQVPRNKLPSQPIHPCASRLQHPQMASPQPDKDTMARTHTCIDMLDIEHMHQCKKNFSKWTWMNKDNQINPNKTETPYWSILIHAYPCYTKTKPTHGLLQNDVVETMAIKTLRLASLKHRTSYLPDHQIQHVHARQKCTKSLIKIFVLIDFLAQIWMEPHWQEKISPVPAQPALPCLLALPGSQNRNSHGKLVQWILDFNWMPFGSMNLGLQLDAIHKRWLLPSGLFFTTCAAHKITCDTCLV